MKIRDHFYDRPLYSANMLEWEKVAKEYIPHFMWYRDVQGDEEIYTIDKEKKRVAWCSYCESAYFDYYNKSADIYTGAYEFLSMKHGEVGNCPCCDMCVTFINENKMTSYSSLQKTRRLIFSDFIDYNHVNFYAVRVVNYPDRYYEAQIIDFEPVAVYELSPGSAKMFRYNGKDWIEQKSIQEPFKTYFGHGGDYEFVLLGNESILDGTFLEYFEFPEFENVGMCQPHFYGDRYFYYMTFLSMCCIYPQLEFFMKVGAYDWVYDLVYNKNKNSKYLDWSAKSYHDMFRVTKQEVKALKDLRFSKRLLEFYYENDKKVSILSLCSIFRGYSTEFISQLISLIVEYKIDIEKLNRYFNSVLVMRDRFNSRVYDASFQIWRDYIEALETLGVDINSKNLLFPKDLIAAHDERMAQVDVAQNEQLIKRAQRSLDRRDKQYTFEDERFIIYLPHFPRELVAESNMQDNCVAKNYTAKHFRDETTICFLREKEKINESLYTIEIQGKTVIQKKGYHNGIYPFTDAGKEAWAYYQSRPLKEADEFYERWLTWVKNGSQRNAKGEPIVEIKKERKRA